MRSFGKNNCGKQNASPYEREEQVYTAEGVEKRRGRGRDSCYTFCPMWNLTSRLQVLRGQHAHACAQNRIFTDTSSPVLEMSHSALGQCREQPAVTNDHRQYKFIILQFPGSEVQGRSHWAKIKVEQVSVPSGD